MMRLRASLNFQDKECLCILEVCFGKLLHSDDRKPGKGQPFCGTSSFQGVWAWHGEIPFQQQEGWKQLVASTEGPDEHCMKGVPAELQY